MRETLKTALWKESLERAMQDAATTGTGYMVNGEHVPPTEVYAPNEGPKMSDVERVARAIARNRGFDSEDKAFRGPPIPVKPCVYAIPNGPCGELHPIWTFFTAEAEAALQAVMFTPEALEAVK